MMNSWDDDDDDDAVYSWAEVGMDPWADMDTWAEGDTDPWTEDDPDPWTQALGEPDWDDGERVAVPASWSRRATAVPADAAESTAVVALSECIRRAVECPVCLVPLRDVACLCPNGHALCGDCAQHLWTRGIARICPLCRALLEPSPDARVTAAKVAELLAVLMVSCAHRPHGCAQLVPVWDTARHEAECEHAPDVPCLVTACQWLATYDRLFEHVFRDHNDVAFVTVKSCLVVRDLFTAVTRNRSRTFLAHSPYGLFWVVLARQTRGRVRVGVFVVKRPVAAAEEATRELLPLPDVLYRITMRYPSGQIRCISRPRKVGRSSSLQRTDEKRGVDAGGGDGDAYTVIQCNRGRIDIHWWLEDARSEDSWRGPRRVPEW